MRILIVGAGGIGGYFGGRLLAIGRDVTFLVRPRRAEQLAKHGLVIRSAAHGDYQHPTPATVQADALRDAYDLVLLSCKAYDLDDAMESFAPAVGPSTAILPMLNGMAHLEALERRFGPRTVLGGLCFIASTLGEDGEIVHLNANHTMVFGERDGSRSERVIAIENELQGANFESRSSDQIVQEMWEKWVFIATGAGITCLMRGSVGEIEAAGGALLARRLLSECGEIASSCGHLPSEKAVAHATKTFTAPGSPLTASMYRDIERGGRTEGEHILGDLLRRGGDPSEYPILHAAHTHVATYEMRRGRQQG